MCFIDLGDCKSCGASKTSAISISSGVNGTGGQFHLWHNPDNSLFLEFERPSGETARYTLSEDLLRKAGALVTSPSPMRGKS